MPDDQWEMENDVLGVKFDHLIHTANLILVCKR